MPTPLPEPTINSDDDLRDDLVEAVAARLGTPCNLDDLLRSDPVNALVLHLGPANAPLWHLVEERVNEFVATSGAVNFAAGYAVGRAAGAAAAGIGRPGDVAAASVGERVVAVMLTSRLPLDEALAAARAAMEAIATGE